MEITADGDRGAYLASSAELPGLEAAIKQAVREGRPTLVQYSGSLLPEGSVVIV
jgi:hypothetical protein